MKRTWVVAPLIVVLVLLVMAGVAVTTLRLGNGDASADRAAPKEPKEPKEPKDLCDRVDPAPLTRVRLTEPGHRRTVRQTEHEGVVTDTCEMSLEMGDVAPPADPSIAPTGDALFFVHVTHHPDAAAAAGDFQRSKRIADGPTGVTGLPEDAYISFRSEQVGGAGYREVELRSYRGAEGLTVRVYGMRESDWDRDGIRTALVEVAKQVLGT